MTDEEQAQPQAEPAAAAETTSEPSLLDAILSKGIRARDEDTRDWGRGLLKEFVSQLLDPKMVVAKDTAKTISLRIAEIDRLLSTQLNEIMHHTDFQKLESSWQGLHYLVHQSETSTTLKIRVLNVSKKDLLKDLERASEFDQSALFKKVYEDEFGTFGGDPYGTLIGDYEFGKHPQDIALLERISNVAAAAHAPFVSAAAPDLFNMDSFTELGGPRDMAKVFDTAEYTKWKSFRDSEDSRFVGLTLPHVLGRLPYGQETCPVEAFNYEEDVDGTDHSKYLWTNAAYALGTRITESFAKYGWLATIRGVEGGGLVEGLPTHTFKTDEGEVALKCPTELAITDRREKELNDLGFIPLCHCKGTDFAAFFGAVGPETQAVRHRRGERQRAAFDHAAVPAVHVAVRSLLEGHGPRQSRLLHGAGGLRTVAQPVDRQLCVRQSGRRRPGGESEEPAAQGARRRARRARQTRVLRSGGSPAAALPVG